MSNLVLLSDFTRMSIIQLINKFNNELISTLTTPLLKTVLILQNQHLKNPSIPKFRGIRDCITTIKDKKGIKGLWRGNTSNLLHAFSDRIIEKIITKIFSKGLSSRESNIKLLSSLAVTNLPYLLSQPMNVVRSLVLSDTSDQFSGILDCISKIYDSKGISGFFQGIIPILIGSLFYKMVYYGFSKRFVYKRLSILRKFALIKATVIISTLAVYPFDTISRRLAVQGVGDNLQVYKGFFDCVFKIGKEEGIAGFFKGVSAEVLFLVAASPILLILDEVIRFILPPRRNNSE